MTARGKKKKASDKEAFGQSIIKAMVTRYGSAVVADMLLREYYQSADETLLAGGPPETGDTPS